MNKWFASHRREKVMGLLLLGLIALATMLTRTTGVDAPLESKFLQTRNLVNITNLIGMYGIFTIGVGLVIITGGIELSLGSVMSLLGVVFYLMLSGGQPWALALLLTILLGLAIGGFHGFCVTRLRMQPFIVTLCGLLAYRGLARVISNDTSVSAGARTLETLNAITAGKFLGMKMPFVYLLVIAAVMFVVLHRSVFGRHLYAVGRNVTASRFAGIRTGRVIAGAYLLCGLFTGISATLFAMYTSNVSPSVHGNFYELYGIAAAVLGGCSLRGGEGSIAGILIGTSIIIVLGNMVNLLGLSSALDYVIIGLVIFIGVAMDEAGGVVKGWFRRRPPAHDGVRPA